MYATNNNYAAGFGFAPQRVGSLKVAQAAAVSTTVATPVAAAPATDVSANEGYVALGYQEGLNVIWSTQRKCIVFLDGNAVTSVTLETHGGASWLFKTYGEKTENGGLKLNLTRARSDLISACQRAGYYNPDHVKGSGIWKVQLNGRRTIVCNSGDQLFDSNGNSVVRASRTAIFTEGKPLGMRPNGALATDADVRELAALYDSWDWAGRSDAALALGWLAIAPFSGVLERRPILALQAPPEAGKSEFVATNKLLLGEGCAAFNGAYTTAAGVMQDMRADSLPVLLDEIFAAHSTSQRDTARVDSLMVLLRTAFGTASGDIGKGTSEGGPRKYSTRFAALIASRSFPVMDDQDRSRMIHCRLDVFKAKRPLKLYVHREQLLPALGERVRNRMLHHWSAFEETAANVREVMVYELMQRERFFEVFGQAIAGWYVLMNARAATLDEARRLVAQFDLSYHVSRINGTNDERVCADWLMGARPANSQHSVGELLRRAEDGHKDAAMLLEDAGVKLNGAYAQICAMPIKGIRDLFADSTWAKGGWDSLLERAPGAKVANPRFCGKTMRAVAVPLAWLYDEPAADAAPVQATIAGEGF